MPLISVIVPVYKTEAYIKRCVDSILAQTEQDFELILVDDGSPDNAGAICDAYAKQDHRIIVIHQENQGPSSARNRGIEWVLENSDSQWFHFVDSDDWLHPQILEDLLHASQEHGTDISICGYTKMTNEGEPFPAHGAAVRLISPEQYYLEFGLLANVAWGKLFRRHCFAHKRFPVGKLHEDMYVIPHVLFEEQAVVLLPDAYYAYYVGSAGITRSTWSIGRMDAIGGFESQLAVFHASGAEELTRATIQQFLISSVFQMIQLYRRPDHRKYGACKEVYRRKIIKLFRYCTKERIPMDRLFRELGDGVAYRLKRLREKLRGKG